MARKDDVKLKNLIEHMNNAEAILFDIDDTLVRTTYSKEPALHACLNALNEKLLKSEKLDFDAFSNHLKNIPRADRIDYKLIEEILTKLGYAPAGNETEIVRAFIAYRDTYMKNLELYPDTLSFLKRLKEVQYERPLQLGIISNGDTYFQIEKLVRTGIDGFFQAYQISGESGHKKPDPEIFQGGLKDLGRVADKSIYIGDRLDNDIGGAKRAGLFAIRIKREDGKYKNQTSTDDYDTPDFEIYSFNELEKLL
jgi:putative hydrolase of the HAD superfamily